MISSDKFVAIQILCNKLWNSLDKRDYDAVVRCFSPQGRWLRTVWCEGQEQIRASLMRRPENLVVRHLITNLDVQEEEGGYRLFVFATAIARYVTPDEKPPYALDRPSLMAEMTGKVQWVDGSPLIAELSGNSIFRDLTLG